MPIFFWYLYYSRNNDSSSKRSLLALWLLLGGLPWAKVKNYFHNSKSHVCQFQILGKWFLKWKINGPKKRREEDLVMITKFLYSPSDDSKPHFTFFSQNSQSTMFLESWCYILYLWRWPWSKSKSLLILC